MLYPYGIGYACDSSLNKELSVSTFALAPLLPRPTREECTPTTTTPVECPADHFRADVLSGLSRSHKRLPAKYFYDTTGSVLFDAITELPEYYPTRTELCILRASAGEMARRCGPHCLLIELGAGSLSKVRFLLDQLHHPAAYVPIDVSGDHLRAAAAALADDYPALDVAPVVADFMRTFALPSLPAARRVVYFPGSTIGNFDPPEVDALLRRVTRLVGPGGGLLLGMDLRKDVRVLEQALQRHRRGNRSVHNPKPAGADQSRIGCRFRPGPRLGISHSITGNASRIEMHLVSMAEQRAQIGREAFEFPAGSTDPHRELIQI